MRDSLGSVSRRRSSIAQLVADAADAVAPGTLPGTALNTLCNVMGAGVLALPLAVESASIAVAVVEILLFAVLGAVAVYILVIGCEATGQFTLASVVAHSAYPLPRAKRRRLALLAAAAAAKTNCGDDDDEDACVHDASPTSAPAVSSSFPGRARRTTDPIRRPEGEEDGGGVADDAHVATAVAGDTALDGADACLTCRADEATDATACPVTADCGGGDGSSKVGSVEEEDPLEGRRAVAAAVSEAIIVAKSYGILVVYGKAIAEAMPPVVEGFLGAAPDSAWTQPWFWLVVSAAAFFPTACARTLDALKFTSLLGFATIFFVAIVVTLRFFASGCEGALAAVPANATPPSTNATSSTSALVDAAYCSRMATATGGQGAAFAGPVYTAAWSTLPAVRATTIFAVAFGFNYNVPLFYRELQRRSPRRMAAAVVGVAFPVITVTYLSAGLCGYLTFGALVGGSAGGTNATTVAPVELPSAAPGNILLLYRPSDVLVNVARLGLFPALALSYPILAIGVRRALHRAICAAVRAARSRRHINAAHAQAAAPSETDALLARHGDDAGGSNARGKAIDAGDPGADVPPDVVAVGEPRWAIVLEAAGLVASTLTVAAVVPGIGIVIEVSGCFFGLWIMFLAPGIVGACHYGRTAPGVSAMRAVSWVLLVVGSACMLGGAVALVDKHAA